MLDMSSIGLYFVHTRDFLGKKQWYTDSSPMMSEMPHTFAKALLPDDVTSVWVSRVRGEWNGHCPPFARCYSRWMNSTQEGPPKCVLKRILAAVVNDAR